MMLELSPVGAILGFIAFVAAIIAVAPVLKAPKKIKRLLWAAALALVFAFWYAAVPAREAKAKRDFPAFLASESIDPDSVQSVKYKQYIFANYCLVYVIYDSEPDKTYVYTHNELYKPPYRIIENPYIG